MGAWFIFAVLWRSAREERERGAAVFFSLLFRSLFPRPVHFDTSIILFYSIDTTNRNARTISLRCTPLLVLQLVGGLADPFDVAVELFLFWGFFEMSE